MSGRRQFEDSVVVSIDKVRDMLRDETKAKPAPVPVAQPVLPSTVEGVPSFAEIAARREERWDDAPMGQAPVVRVAPRRKWKGPVVAAVLGAMVAGGAVFAVHAAEGEPAPFQAATVAYDDAVDNAVLQAELRAAHAEAEASRIRIKALEAELEALKAEPPPASEPAAVAAAEPAPKKAKKRRKKRRRSAKRTKSTRSRRVAKRPKKRRRPKKLNKSDKNLDALIDGL